MQRGQAETRHTSLTPRLGVRRSKATPPSGDQQAGGDGRTIPCPQGCHPPPPPAPQGIVPVARGPLCPPRRLSQPIPVFIRAVVNGRHRAREPHGGGDERGRGWGHRGGQVGPRPPPRKGWCCAPRGRPCPPPHHVPRDGSGTGHVPHRRCPPGPLLEWDHPAKAGSVPVAPQKPGGPHPSKPGPPPRSPNYGAGDAVAGGDHGGGDVATTEGGTSLRPAGLGANRRGSVLAPAGSGAATPQKPGGRGGRARSSLFPGPAEAEDRGGLSRSDPPSPAASAPGAAGSWRGRRGARAGKRPPWAGPSASSRG